MLLLGVLALLLGDALDGELARRRHREEVGNAHEVGDAIGRLGAYGHPVPHAVVVEPQFLGAIFSRNGIVGAELAMRI